MRKPNFEKLDHLLLESMLDPSTPDRNSYETMKGTVWYDNIEFLQHFHELLYNPILHGNLNLSSLYDCYFH